MDPQVKLNFHEAKSQAVNINVFIHFNIQNIYAKAAYCDLGQRHMSQRCLTKETKHTSYALRTVFMAIFIVGPDVTARGLDYWQRAAMSSREN